MIDFDLKPNDEASTSRYPDVITGTYDLSQMPVSGNYFVEIIVVLCESYGERFRSVDLLRKCLEGTSGENHRITNGNGTASIDIVVNPASKGSSTGGSWLHESFLLGNNTQLNNNKTAILLPPKPLYTRYQPEECVVSKNWKMPYCQDAVNHRHKAIMQYHYRWNQGGLNEVLNEPVLGKFLADNNGITESNGFLKLKEDTNVCWVGASHSRVANSHCENILDDHNTWKAKQTKVLPLDTDTHQLRCSHSEFQKLGKITEGWIAEWVIGKGCTHAVMGLFQHPFSFKQVRMKNSTTFTFDDWKAVMIHNVGILERAVRSNDNPLKRIILRSAHTNGLKSQVIECPPRDIRTPPNAYVATNTILPEIANHFSNLEPSHETTLPVVSYLNADFLIAPVWDMPHDWSHYESEAGRMETKFILSEILKEEVLHQSS